jgi:hypothetical protein
MKKEILFCVETKVEIAAGRLVAGRHPDSQITYSFDSAVIEKIPPNQRGYRQRNAREGGINFFRATSKVDAGTGYHTGDNFKVGDFRFSLSPEVVNNYLKQYALRRRGFR